MVSKPEGCNNNGPTTHNQYESAENPSSRKSLRQFSQTLSFKHNIAVCRLCLPKENIKATITNNVL